MLGLCCCSDFSLITAGGGYSPPGVCRLLPAEASLLAELGLQGVQASLAATRGLSRCGSQALEHRLSSCGARSSCSMACWDLPGPGNEPVSPALAGGFFTTEPSGKPILLFDIRKELSHHQRKYLSVVLKYSKIYLEKVKA